MTTPTRAATALTCYDTPPQIAEGGVKRWIHRAANFTVEVCEAEAGAQLSRLDQPDEYLVITTPGAELSIEAGQTVSVNEPALAIVPPGPSSVTAMAPGRFVRIFSSKAGDIAAAAANAAAYAEPAEGVASLTEAGSPEGYGLRVYPLSEYAEIHPDKPFTLFRSASLMVNIFKPFLKPRDTTRLSPHSHADFEQCSLALDGLFVHRLRYPWTPNLADWREDEELALDSPSMLTIPNNVIHTTYFVGDGQGWLIDIFGPPRADFMSKPGLVLNENHYPAA